VKCIVLVRGKLKTGTLSKIEYGRATVTVSTGGDIPEETLTVPIRDVTKAWSDEKAA